MQIHRQDLVSWISSCLEMGGPTLTISMVLLLLNGLMVTQAALFFTHRQSNNKATEDKTEEHIMPPITNGVLCILIRIMEENQKKKMMDWIHKEGILADENRKPPLRLY